MIDWNMVIGETVTQVLRVLIPVLIALIMKWAIQLYEQIKKDQPDFAKVLQVAVNQAVIAVEQTMQTEEGQKKKEAAIESASAFLKAKGCPVDVKVIEDAIEATVYSLHRDNFFLTKEQREFRPATEYTPAPDEVNNG